MPLSDVLLIHRDIGWCNHVIRLLGGRGICASWVASESGLARACRRRPIDAVLLDLDVFEPDEGIHIVTGLTHGSPAPAVIAFSRVGVPASRGFELGRLGVRDLLPDRPAPSAVLGVFEEVLASPPALAPIVRASVGHLTYAEMVREVRMLHIDQALAAADGNQSEASRSLRISRQTLAKVIKERDEPIPDRAAG